jgi:hypothetical protein
MTFRSLLTIRDELRKVVIKGGVDDAIRHGRRSAAQTFQVFKITSMHLGSGGIKGLGACLRPRQSEYLMARVDQFPNNGRTDKTCSTSYEYTHHGFSFTSLHDDGQLLIPELKSEL